jgi:hypothetical protein
MNDLDSALRATYQARSQAIEPPSLLEEVLGIPDLDIPQQRAWPLPFPKWRFQSMFNATKFVVAGVIVALFGGFLLSGVLTQPNEESVPAVGASASASPQDADAMVPSVFALRLRGGKVDPMEADVDPDTGLVTMTGMAFEAIDPVVWEAAAKDDNSDSIFPLALHVTSGPGDADPRALGVVTEVWAVKDDVLGAEEGSVGVVRRRTRVENDGGAWIGTATVPSIGVGIRLGAAFWELVGESGYEGLTMFLWGDFRHYPDMLLGIIVPSDSVPDFPPPPPVADPE